MSVSVRLSVCLSVVFVHCGHRVQWIPDTFACLDRWMSLLLTDNASPGSSDRMMPGFLLEEGRRSSRAILATARPSCLLCNRLNVAGNVPSFGSGYCSPNSSSYLLSISTLMLRAYLVVSRLSGDAYTRSYSMAQTTSKHWQSYRHAYRAFVHYAYTFAICFLISTLNFEPTQAASLITA